ncbi:hypothetical protein CN918_26795 [Priestia megaterium]|nr:hypothetical protein CN918_26795 [Priestia megaterium]
MNGASIRLKEKEQGVLDVIEFHDTLAGFAINGVRVDNLLVEIDLMNGVVYEGTLRLANYVISEKEMTVTYTLENRMLLVTITFDEKGKSGRLTYKSKK